MKQYIAVFLLCISTLIYGADPPAYPITVIINNNTETTLQAKTNNMADWSEIPENGGQAMNPLPLNSNNKFVINIFSEGKPTNCVLSVDKGKVGADTRCSNFIVTPHSSGSSITFSISEPAKKQ